MTHKTICVTGHRKVPDDKQAYVRHKLTQEVKSALNDGYRTFITGFADGTDMLFAQVVNEQRGEYPDIFLEAALPSPKRIKRLNSKEQELLRECNGITFTSKENVRGSFFIRNRYMVQQSDRVIAVYDGREEGGTFSTMRYAKVMGCELRVVRI